MSKTTSPWLICITAALYFFYIIFQMSSFNTISAELMRSLAINTAQLGNLSACYFYAAALTMLLVGLLLDRFSTRRLLLLMMGLSVLCTIIFAFTGSVIIAAFCRAVEGTSNAFAFLGCMRLVYLWFPPQRRALVMGLMIALGMSGSLVAQTPLAFMLKIMTWRQAILISAAVGCLFLLLMWIFIVDKPGNQQQDVNLQQFWQSFRNALHNSQNWLCGLFTGLLNLSVLLLGALWGSLYLVQSRHIPLTEAATISSMIFVGLIVGSPIVGIISDWLQCRRLPMLLGASLSILIVLLIMYVPFWSWQMLLILFFLLGFFSSTQVISYSIIAESNEKNSISTSMSIISILVNLAAAIGQPLFGWLIKWHEAELSYTLMPANTSADYQFALMILPVAFLISLLAAYKLRETHGKALSH